MQSFQCAACFNFLLAAILFGRAFAEIDDPRDSKLDGASLLQTHGLIGDEDQDHTLQPETPTVWMSKRQVTAMYTREALDKMIASGRMVTRHAEVTQYRIVNGTHNCQGPNCVVKPTQGANQEATHNIAVGPAHVQNLVHRQNIFSVQGPCGVSGPCVQSPNYPSDYVNGDDCTISVMEDADLRIVDFNTESGYDHLYVNGNRYSGSSNPLATPFRASQPIGWSADHSVTRKGWEICMSGCEAIVYEHGDFTGWEVVLPVGVYNVDAMRARGAGNDAVSSLKVNGQNCRAIAYEHGDFTGWQVAFPTGEFNVDSMRAMGAGNDGISSIRIELVPTPSPTLPPPTESPTPAPTEFPTESPTPLPTPLPTLPPPTESPTPAPTELPTESPTPLPTPLPTDPLFAVQQGACSVSGDCVTSPAFPSSYSNGDACSIAVREGTSLSLTDFDTESGYDKLYIGGNPYSGMVNPFRYSSFHSIYPIGWTTDNSVTRKGWRICAGCQVFVYEHGDFTGWEAVLPVGEYDVGAMQARGAGNDAVSSIKVIGESCQAIVFQHGDFTGIEVVFPTGEYDAAGMRARGASNDEASSIKVEVVTTVSPTEPPTPPPTESPTPLPTEAPTEPVTQPQTQQPYSADFSPSHLDFRVASITENNLGGMGPVSGSRNAIFFQGVAADGTTDLLVSNVTEYFPWKVEVNGFAAANASFAQVNLKCGESVTLRFSFLDSATGQPKSLDRFNFTIADLDRGTHGRCRESVEVADYAGYTLAPNSTIQASVDSSSGVLRFAATEAGEQVDNPETMEEMSMDQKQKSVNFMFRNTESLTVTFSTRTGLTGDSQDPAIVGYGGRRLLFAVGSS